MNDTRPIFWPISVWEWSSPVSYYDDEYYGGTFSVVEHGIIAATMLLLALKRLKSRGRGDRPGDRSGGR